MIAFDWFPFCNKGVWKWTIRSYQYGGGIWVVLCTDFQSGWRDALQGVHSRNVEGTLQLANFWQQLSYYNAVYKAYTRW